LTLFDDELSKVSERENLRDILFYRDHEEEPDHVDYERAGIRAKFLANYNGPVDSTEAEILYKECMHSYFGGLTLGNFLDTVWDYRALRVSLLNYMIKQYNDMDDDNPHGLNIWDKQNLHILTKVAEYLISVEKRK